MAAIREVLAGRGAWDRFFRGLGRVEQASLVLLLAGLIVFGCLQIVLRNFFGRGLIWADPLMRHIVLWLGCLGGAFASSRMNHINIDVLTRLLPPRMKSVRDRVVYAATAVAAAALAAAALRLVADERTFGEKAFLDLDTWFLQLVLPVAFFIIAYRSMRFAIRGIRDESAGGKPLSRRVDRP